MGNEADRFDGLLRDEFLIVSKCQMRNEMIRRFEPIPEHLDTKQFVEFENRPIIGEKHKRAMRWPAPGRWATRKAADIAKRDLESRHVDTLARSQSRKDNLRPQSPVISSMLQAEMKSLNR